MKCITSQKICSAELYERNYNSRNISAYFYAMISESNRGKENGLQILQSIDQGPFELGTTRDTLETTPEGGVLLGPKRPRTYEDLSDTKKKYHTDLVNDMRNIRMTMPNIQLNSKFMNNMSPEWDRQWGAQNRVGNANAGQGKLVKCYNYNRVGHIARNYTQLKRPQNSDYFKDKMLLMQAQENGAVLDEEELLFLAGELTLLIRFMMNHLLRLFWQFVLSQSQIHKQSIVMHQSYLRQDKKAQPTLYDGDELLKPHHVPVIVPSSEEELELATAKQLKEIKTACYNE
ncbi:hypothetical protein Tco_1155620 [Tanacetum coccineum]